MDFLVHAKAILGLLAFVVLYYFRAHSKKSKGTEPPEPSGAWPLLGHLPLLGGEGRDRPIARTLGALADKYGPIYSLRLGTRRALIVSSWEMMKDCFTTNDRVFATRPSIAAGRYLGYDNAFFALAPYGNYWRDIRKMAILKLLSTQQLEKLEHIRVTEINSYIKNLLIKCRENENHPIEVTMDTSIEHLTFNIIIRMIAGKRLHSTSGGRDETAWQLEKAVKKAAYLSGVYALGDAIPYLEWMDVEGHVSSMKKTAKEIDLVLGSWLEEHLKNDGGGGGGGGGDNGDFMDAMAAALPVDTVMAGHKRDTIIKSTALTLILTGSESTSVTLTWALSLLLNNRHVLKKAQEELDIRIGKNRQVQESDINNLKYLQAIMKETLRLYPPSPLTGIREAAESCYVGGHYIPKGTWLLGNIWKLHRDPRVWSNPDEFRPERFLTSHADIDVKGLNYEYIPFSAGRRSCPGMNFGLKVVHLTLACLLHEFDITTLGEMRVDMQEGLGIALPKLKPLNMVITPRLSLALYE